MPRVMCLQHAASVPPGRIEEALADRKITVFTIRLHAGAWVPPVVDGFQGLVLLGGTPPGNGADRQRRAQEEIRLVEKALFRGIPVLGICSGSRLLAAALGATLTRGGTGEIGWHPVTLTPEATRDPLFADVASPFPAFHWHDESFELPARAVALASSARTACQAFRWGRNVWGLQCHLEATPEIVDTMARAFADRLAAAGLERARLVAAARERESEVEQVGRRVFGRWADLVAAGGG